MNLSLEGGTWFKKCCSNNNVLVSKLCYLQHEGLQFICIKYLYDET